MAEIRDWSATAAGNSAAPPDGFPENMPPSAVNDAARELMAAVKRWYDDAEWRDLGHAPAFATADSFTLAGDLTAVYTPGRRLRLADATTLYGTVDAAGYSAPNTTVTVTLDAGGLTAALSAVALDAWSAASERRRFATPKSLPDGSGAAPALAFATEPGLGIYRFGAGEIGMTGALRRHHADENATFYHLLRGPISDGARLAERRTAAVSTTPTTIMDNLLRASVVIVSGLRSGGSDIFADLLFASAIGGTVFEIRKQSAAGSPDGRAYSISSSNLQLSMSANTYNVRALLLAINPMA